MRFNGLRYLLIEDSKLLKEIPELPESIRSVNAANCISLNSQSIRNLFDQVPSSLQDIKKKKKKQFCLPFQILY